MADKRGRQQRILELLAHNRIQSHEQLQDLLLAEDMACSQTTLSRDLRELGVVPRLCWVQEAPLRTKT